MTFKIYFQAFALTLLMATNINAQNPPYYLSIDEQPYVEIQGTDLIGYNWDDPEFEFPIGFEFLFMGEPITDFYQIGTGAILTGSPDLYTVADAKLFFVYGSDIIDLSYYTNGPTGVISRTLEGSPGSQICKVQWKDVGFYEDATSNNPTNSTVNFQAWFYETSHTIEIRFGPNNIVAQDSAFHDWGGDPLIAMMDNVDFGTYTFGSTYYVDGPEGTATLSELTAPSIYDLEDLSSLSSNPIDGRVYRFTTAPVVDTEEPGLQELVKIYPSLATDFTLVNINQQNFTTADIQIINTLGQVVHQQNAHSGAQQIELSNLVAGSYFIRVQVDGKSFSQRIVKQ